MTGCGLKIIADWCFFKVRLADETVVAASEADIFLFPPQKGNSVTKCGVLEAIFWVLLYQSTKVPPAERTDRKI